MTFMWRRYRPKTNRFSLARIFSSHLPLEGKLIGIDGPERGRRDKTLTKRTMAGRTGGAAGDWSPDHDRACRADVDGIEVLQVFGERGRSEGPMTADVDPSQKNHECHEFPPAGTARQLIRQPPCLRNA